MNDQQTRPSNLATPADLPHPKLIKSFVRRTGRTTSGQARAIAEIGPRFVFPFQANMADWLGDPTAKYADRLTLNPLSHLDPFGSFLMPLLLFFGTGGRFFFASAKPVPYNPYNL